MKVYCSKCKKDKDSSEFYKSKSRNTGYNGHCKECLNKSILNHQRTKRGVLMGIYNQMIRNSKKRNQDLPNFTIGEFIDKFIYDETFVSLYNNWVYAEYETWLKPSFDKIRYGEPYTFLNFKIVTWKENWSRQNSDKTNQTTTTRKQYRRKVYTIIEGEKKVFDSLNKASKFVGLSNAQDIKNSIIRNGTAGGLKWNYE